MADERSDDGLGDAMGGGMDGGHGAGGANETSGSMGGGFAPDRSIGDAKDARAEGIGAKDAEATSAGGGGAAAPRGIDEVLKAAVVVASERAVDDSETKRKRARDESRNSSAIDFGVPTLKHFASFTRVPQMLEGYILAALQENRRLDHMLIHGRVGSGTTTLARALARDYAPNRIEELDTLIGIPPMKLMRALQRANRRGVVIIRHIELLDGPCAQMVAAYMRGKPFDREQRAGGSEGMRPPWESDLDRDIASSARDNGSAGASREPGGSAMPNGTIIGTALLPGRLHYQMRTGFEQLIHLRSDPKALRMALARVLRKHGVAFDPACHSRVERVLGTLVEGTDQLARAALARAQYEGVDTIDDELMKSIIEEDLAARLADMQYTGSLRDHLAGRRVKCATAEEVARIAQETGWGEVAVRSALVTMIREDRARKNSDRPQMPA